MNYCFNSALKYTLSFHADDVDVVFKFKITYVFHTCHPDNLEDTRTVRSRDHTGVRVYSHMIEHRAHRKSQRGILRYGIISYHII